MLKIILYSSFFFLGCKGFFPTSNTKSQFENSFNIVGQNNHDLTLLHQVANNSVLTFQNYFGELSEKITLDLSGQNCLRVGYNFKENVVKFCDTQNIKNQGLLSVDVIAHEIFHAMICSKFKSFCHEDFIKIENNEALHEGLADYFSYTLNNDAKFGENFYKDKDFIRNYHSSYCFNLTPGSHGKGNSIVSDFISKNISFNKIASHFSEHGFNMKNLLSAPCFQEHGPIISYSTDSHPQSKLHRYKIKPELPLKLKFTMNEAMHQSFPHLRIVWIKDDKNQEDKFKIEAADTKEYLVTPISQDGWAKYYAQFYDSNNLIVGFQQFYFSVSN